MSEQEHDISRSEKVVGQLLPIIKDSKGRVVDGLHREKENAHWRVEIWDSVKTEEDYWKTRAHLNYSRRNAHDARQEKLQIINSLAEFYVKQGLHVSGGKRGDGQPSAPINEVLDAVIKALDGALSANYIRQNIDSKYKQNQEKSEPQEPTYRGTPEESILGQYGESRKGLAEKVIEDVKKKAVEEAKKDPEFRAEIVKEEREKVVSEIKKEYPSPPKIHGPRYYRNVVNTFYRIRGWGVPMVLSMGRETWDKTRPYVQGIHDWSGFLLSIKPEDSVDRVPEPPKLQVPVDQHKIIEADYQILGDK